MVGHGKRIKGRTIVRNTQSDVQKKDLEELKESLIAQIAALIASQPQQTVVIQGAEATKANEFGDIMFIPSDIAKGTEMDAEINIETKESSDEGLDAAAAALKAMKQKNKEENND